VKQVARLKKGAVLGALLSMVPIYKVILQHCAMQSIIYFSKKKIKYKAFYGLFALDYKLPYDKIFLLQTTNSCIFS
jgi:hypothetical protein